MALNNHVENFTLDMAPGGIAPVLNVSQGDTGRAYTADMYWGGASYDVSGLTVRLRGRKRDNTVFDYALPAPSGTKVAFDLEDKEQVTIIPGNVECELVFTDSNSRVVGTANFVFIVEESPYDPNALSQSVIPGIEDLVEQTIGGDVSDEVDAWLEAHPEATTTVQDGAISYQKLDTSLKSSVDTIEVNSGRIDNLVANAGDTDGNAELLDIRVAYDGTTYPTAGDAVRGQVSDLKNDLVNTVSPIFDEWEQGNIRHDNGQEEANTNACRSVGYYIPEKDTFVTINNPAHQVIAIRRWNADGTFAGTDTVTWKLSYKCLYGYKYRAVDASTGTPASITATFTVPSDISVTAVKTEVEDMKSNVYNMDNLLLSSRLVENQYYGTTDVSNNAFSYFEIPVESGTTYNFGSIARYVSNGSAVLAENVKTYTVSTEESIFVTFYNSNRDVWAVCSSDKDITTVGTYDDPVVNENFVRLLNGEIENLQTEVNAVKEYTDYMYIVPEYIQDTFISKTSGAAFEASNYVATDFIEVEEYGVYHIYTACADDSSGYGFYDEDENYLWGSGGGLFSDGAVVRKFEIEAPHKAKYIRFSCLKSRSAASYGSHIEMGDIIKSIKGYIDGAIAEDNAVICWTNEVKPPFWIFGLDCARKYFTIANIKTIVDLISAAGFNQLMIHLSTDQAFRFELDDMEFTIGNTTYDLAECLGGVESPTSWYDQDDMDEIINYCHSKNIDFVPLFDMPGHMGKILSVFTQFKYNSTNTLDITNPNAVNFAKAIADRYTKYFASRGCNYYNMGYDEIVNSTGFADFYDNGEYNYVVDFANEISRLIKDNGLKPMIFNEAVNWNFDYKYQVDKDFTVLYWFGLERERLASAQRLQNYNYKLVNSSFFLYWILGNTERSTTVEYINSIDLLKNFYGGTLAHNSFGAALWAWCDGATSVDVGDGGDGVVTAVTPLIEAFGDAIDRVLDI